MASIKSKIVLTGGPCAGKTTGLKNVDETLSELGYKVIIVPEAATIAINSGLRCFGEKPLNLYDFQNFMLKFQSQNERLIEETVKHYPEHTKCVLLYDRGLMDNSAYIDTESFEKLLIENNLSKIELLDHYDMVLHMVTAADGAEEFYTLANNAARSEGIEEAIALDRRTLNAWINHTNLHIIDNSTSFDDKINRVINSILEQLDNPVRVKTQKKYLVDISCLSKKFLDNLTPIEITQTYLGDDEYERRLRTRTISGYTTYSFLVQKQDLKGKSFVYTEKRISEKEYYDYLNLFEIKKTITKTRYAFVSEKEKYKLDIFPDGTCILETNINSKLVLPAGIHILKDVTSDQELYNYNLAKKTGAKILTPVNM